MRRIAWASLRAHPLRLFATALSVVLGIAFVTGTYVFTDTVQSAFDELFGSAASGVDVVVRASAAFETASAAGRPGVPGEVLATVTTVGGVAQVEPRYSGQASLVDAEGNTLGATGPPKQGSDAPSVPELATVELRSGRWPAGRGEVAIDVQSAEALDAAPGEAVQVLLNGPTVEHTLVGTVGLVGGRDDFAGSTFTVFDDITAQQLYGTGGAVTLAVLAAEGVDQVALRDAIATAIGPDYEALTGSEVATEAADQVGEFLGFLTTGLLVFAGVALLVAAVIILNTFGITVAQRTRELALLQAVGADARQVIVAVLLEAVAVGLVGSVVGVGAGVAVASGLRALLDAVGVPLPATTLVLAPRTVVVGIALGVLVTVAAAVGPALRASRVAPVEALRTVAAPPPARLGPARVIAGVVAAAVGVAGLVLGLGAVGERSLWLAGAGALGVLAALVALSPLVLRPVANLLGGPVARMRGLPGLLARENATRNPRRTAATASALIIGLGLVCFVLIFVASLRASVDAVLEERFLADYQITTTSITGFPTTASDVLRAVPGVEVVSAAKLAPVGIDGRARIALAVDPVTFPQTFALDVTSGSLAELSPDTVAVADEVLADLGLTLGDTLELELVPDQPAQPFRVIATYDPVGLPGVNNEVGQLIVDYGRYAAAVPITLDAASFVRLADAADPAVVRPALEQALAPFDGVALSDAAEIRAQVAEQTNQLLGLVFGLLLLSVVIALVGVVNILGLSVLERTREIGLLQAVGMTRGQAREMVRWESVIISLLGALLGLVIGVVFGWVGVRALEQEGLEVFRVPVLQMVAAVLVAGVAGVAASVLPARRASRVDVLRALQVD